ncbi:MAG: hypothetical protein KKD05_02115 [Candidatus Omnitrophica bacterium]|nr:hypothetical protein [Candidatus Omnitrophota bacterium]
MKKKKANRFFPRIFMLILMCFFAACGCLFAGGADTLAPVLFLDKADLRGCFTAGVDKFARQLENENQRQVASMLEKDGDLNAIKNVMRLITDYRKQEDSALGREQAGLMIGHFTEILESLRFRIDSGRLEKIYLELLDDADPQIRRASISQLSAVAGNKSIKRAMILLMSEDAFMVKSALGILKEHRITEAVSDIVPLCGHPDETVAEEAMSIIKDFNPGIETLESAFVLALTHPLDSVSDKAVSLFSEDILGNEYRDPYRLLNNSSALVRAKLAQILIDKFDSFSDVRQREIGINLLSVFKTYSHEYFPAVKKLYDDKFFSNQAYLSAMMCWVLKMGKDYDSMSQDYRLALEEFNRVKARLREERRMFALKQTLVGVEDAGLRGRWTLPDVLLKSDEFFNVGTLYDLLCLLEFKEHISIRKLGNEVRVFSQEFYPDAPFKNLGKKAHEMLKSQELLVTLRQQDEETEWGYADLGKVVPFGAQLVFNINTKRNYSITLQTESGKQIPLQIFFCKKSPVLDNPRHRFVETAI